MNSEKTKFKLFTISYEVSDVGYLPFPEICNSILAIATDPKWWFQDGEFRYTLIKCQKMSDSVVHGFIAQQHTLDQHLYDEIKHSSDNKLESYEDRFFVLDLTSFKLSVEWRRFRNKPPLNLQLTVDRIHKIFLEAVKLNSVQAKIHFEAVDYYTSKQEFIEIFYSNHILEINVDDFGKFPVYNDVRLVNPSVHLEDAAREMIHHDVLHPSISKLIAEAKQDGQGNLRSSIIARAAMHSGQPAVVKYQDPAGDIRIRKRTEKGEYEINLPIDSTDSLEERTKAVIAILEGMNKIDVRHDDRVKVNPQMSLFSLSPDGSNDG